MVHAFTCQNYIKKKRKRKLMKKKKKQWKHVKKICE